MENDGGEVVGDTKMAEATALTNGHVNDAGTPEESVIIKSVPKVTESFKSSENIGENSSDVERFKSKLTETSDRVGDTVVDSKQYEENALKAMSERTDNTEMSSTTETRLGQTDLVQTTDSGAVKSLYREDQEKKHETASKTSEQAGDMSSKKETSEKSHQRSSVTVDASSDGSHGVLVDLGNDTSSQSFEEIQGEGFRGTRKVESSRSERNMEYTSEGGSGANAVDFASQLDELFDPRGEYSKKDRDKRSVSFMGKYDEMERLQGGASSRVQHDDIDGYSARRKGYQNEIDRYSTESHSSSTSSRLSSRGSTRRDNSLDEGEDYKKASWGLSTDRRTADDLIQRILAESRGRPAPARSPGVSRVQEEERPFSPSARYSPTSPRFDPGEVPPRFRPDEGPLTPTSPTAKKDIFKVDMGDGVSKRNAAEVSLSAEEEQEHRSSSHMRSEAFSSEHMVEDRADRNMVVALPKSKPRHEEMSLLDRRLASMGFDTKLGQEMYVDKQGGGNEGYVETTYISKTKPPGFIANDEDDLDQEIDALRSSYREGIQRRNRYLQDDYEEEPLPVARQNMDMVRQNREVGLHSMENSYRSRGRMVRQDYVEDGDAFNYGAPPPPPPEDFIPDEDFVPQKRPETEDVVKEKTSSIRTVVEKQSTVLEKLREASNSFDELNSEIRNIKQQFMENQMKRSYLMNDDFERPDDVYPPNRGGGYDNYRGGGYDPGRGYAGRDANYDPELEEGDQMTRGIGGRASYSSGSAGMAGLTDDYKPYIPRKQRMAMQRSQSLFDDAPYMGGHDATEDGPRGPPQISPGAGPNGTGRYEPIEDDEDEDALGYGGQPQRKARYDFESAQPLQRRAYDFESDQPLQRRAYDFENAQPPPRRAYDFEDDQPPPKRNYEYESPGYSSTAAKYLSRPAFTRANTLADFNFDRPSSPTFVRHDRYDRPSTFSSRFLDKVRDKKRLGGGDADTSSSATRDKPFKSRFLRDSFTGSASSTTSFSSTRSSRISTGGASEAGASSSSATDATQNKTEGAPTDTTATEPASNE